MALGFLKQFIKIIFLQSARRVEDLQALKNFYRRAQRSLGEQFRDEAGVDLQIVEDQVLGNRAAESEVLDYLRLCRNYHIPTFVVLDLFKGLRSEILQPILLNDRELLIYCYQIAGTAAMAATPIFSVRDAKAFSFAMDLGIAMKITSICRDVLKDAQHGHVFIPAERLVRSGISSHDILTNTASVAATSKVVRELLSLADAYYESGLQGLRYIPLRLRAGVLMTARWSQALGEKLAKRGYNPLLGAVTLTPFEKLWIGVKAFAQTYWLAWSERNEPMPSHNEELHWALKPLFSNRSLVLQDNSLSSQRPGPNQTDLPLQG